jgi:hypothetical protein
MMERARNLALKREVGQPKNSALVSHGGRLLRHSAIYSRSR